MRFVTPSPLSGEVHAPGSKSVAQRALLLAARADGPSTLRGITLCDDVLACIDVLRALGANVHVDGQTATVFPMAEVAQATPSRSTHRQGQPSRAASCRESGTTFRMAAAIGALDPGRFTLIAEGSLARRPMAPLVDSLRAAGVDVVSSDGSLTVAGPLRGGEFDVDGSLSSQPVSGLALALPQADGPSRVTVKGLVSRGYLDVSVETARACGLEIALVDDVLTTPGSQRPSGTDMPIPGDWSAAAFWLVAGALGGPLAVVGLDLDSRQPDRMVVDVLRSAGAQVTVTADGITVASQGLTAFEVDAIDAPDVIPPLVCLALGCEGTSTIRGAERLRVKESDRAAVLASELGGLGARIRVDGDALVVTGGALRAGVVDPHGDHRMAMAAAVVAPLADGPIGIRNPGCVAKSYPDFFADLERMQA